MDRTIFDKRKLYKPSDLVLTSCRQESRHCAFTKGDWGHFRGSGTLMGYKNVKIKLVSILSIYTFLESPDISEYGYECKKC